MQPAVIAVELVEAEGHRIPAFECAISHFATSVTWVLHSCRLLPRHVSVSARSIVDSLLNFKGGSATVSSLLRHSTDATVFFGFGSTSVA